MVYLYFITSILLNVSANICFKLSATKGFYSFTAVSSFFRENSILFVGVTLFALSTVSYFMTLKALPVSTVYPVIVGSSFLLTNMAAFYFLKERITMLQVIGYVCIVFGVICVLFYRAK